MTDPFSTEALVEWLRKQPADQGYDYGDSCGCLLARYLQSAVNSTVYVSSSRWFMIGPISAEYETELPEGWDDISIGLSDNTWTFGAALARAEALLAKEKSQ